MSKNSKEGISNSRSLYLTCSEEQFAEICDIISKLRDLRYEHLVVVLYGYPLPLEFIQTVRARWDKDPAKDYYIEIGLERGGKHVQMFRSPSITKEECIDVFRTVCMEMTMPDLTEWEDITDEIFPKNNFVHYCNRVEWFFQRLFKRIFAKKKKENRGGSSDDELKSGPPRRKITFPDAYRKLNKLLIKQMADDADRVCLILELGEAFTPEGLIDFYCSYIEANNLQDEEIEDFIKNRSQRIIQMDLWLKDNLDISIIDAEKEGFNKIFERITTIGYIDGDIIPKLILNHLKSKE